MNDALEKPTKIIWGNAVFLFLTPLLSVILAPLYLVHYGFSWPPMIAAFTLFALTGLGITSGYHRLWSHRTYKAAAPIRLILAIIGGAAWQNSIVEWCSDHRRHHRFVDTDEDPYNAQKGFWWSHMGWILVQRSKNDFSNVKDLLRDPICKWQHDHFYKITIAFNVGLPLILGLIFNDVLGMLLFAGLVRVVLVHHVTFCINSLAHMIGNQKWSRDNSARDSWVLGMLTFGEGYHNYHHAFETDYRNGPLWYNFDPAKWIIWCLSKVNLAWDIRRTPADLVLRKRYEERREDMAEVLQTFGQRMETWREEVSERAAHHASAARQGLESHLLRAEERLENAFSDMRKARNAYAAARRSEASKRELQTLRAAAKHAHRSVKTAFSEWEQVLTDWTAMAVPVPA